MLPTIAGAEEELLPSPPVRMTQVLLIFLLGLGASLLVVGCVLSVQESACVYDGREDCDNYAPLFLLSGGVCTVITFICLCPRRDADD